MNKDKLITLTKEIAKREIDREYESLDVIADWCSSIIEFINRDKPIKPKQFSYEDEGKKTADVCGFCYTPITRDDNYCKTCGAMIDWGEK